MCFSVGSTFTYIFYILIALLALLVMITIHEFGHFIAGRKLGFKINEFAVGFGKILLKHKTKDGILVTLRLIPLGGYCAFDGEDENSLDPNAFNNKSPWKRLIVLFNGAFFNFISAVIISFVLLCTFGYGDLVQVKNVEPYATNISSVRENDVIYEVNGTKTNFLNDTYFSALVKELEIGEEFTMKVKRDGEFVDITAKNGLQFVHFTDTITGQDGYNVIDGKVVFVSLSGGYYYVTEQTTNNEIAKIENKEDEKFFAFKYDNHNYIFVKESNEMYSALLGVTVKNYVYTIPEALAKAVPFTCEWAWKILVLLGSLITGQIGLDGVGGPITTISSIANYTQTSWINLLILFPLISVNLAVFNLLPFPALDGARMVFVVIEWIRGKPIKRNIESYIHTLGLLLLFGFVIIVDAMNLLF